MTDSEFFITLAMLFFFVGGAYALGAEWINNKHVKGEHREDRYDFYDRDYGNRK